MQIWILDDVHNNENRVNPVNSKIIRLVKIAHGFNIKPRPLFYLYYHLMFTAQPHPYGVLPAGNSFLYSSDTYIKVKMNGLGMIYSLSDEIIIDILSYLPHDSLARISACSRVLYVFSCHFELWRDLVLRYWPNHTLDYRVTWKDTFISSWLAREKSSQCYSNHEEIYPLTIPIKIHGIFSDALYRSWSCYSFDIETSCPGFTTLSDILTEYSPETLSIEEFYINLTYLLF